LKDKIQTIFNIDKKLENVGKRRRTVTKKQLFASDIESEDGPKAHAEHKV
jgi:hypothetical protein